VGGLLYDETFTPQVWVTGDDGKGRWMFLHSPPRPAPDAGKVFLVTDQRVAATVPDPVRARECARRVARDQGWGEVRWRLLVRLPWKREWVELEEVIQV